MSLVKLKFVVSFTSQDKKHTIENLMKQDGSGRWLCAPEDRSGRLEAVLQLERACIISHIDIGTFRALCLTIQVGRSSWELGKEYKDFVVGTTMMSPAEARTGAGKNCMKMFKYDSFCADARDEAWDRIKIVLTQPFRKDIQLGLSLLRIMSSDAPGQDSSSAPRRIPTLSSSSAGGEAATPARLVNNRNSYNSPSWRSTDEIKRHFFKRDQDGNKREEEVKNTLLKIGSTAENGSSQGVLASRITKMVMAAAGKSPAYKPRPFPSPSNVTSALPQTPSESSPAPRRSSAKLTFEGEVAKFLNGLEIENLDLNKMSFADLRHQLEKIKCRKLSKEEKKTFFALTKAFIEKITSAQTTTETNNGSKRKSGSDQEESVPKKRQVEKEDFSLAERLGASPESRPYLAALKSPQVMPQEKPPTPGVKQISVNQNHIKNPASPANVRRLPQAHASPSLKKGKVPPDIVFYGGSTYSSTVKSKKVKGASASERGSFEATLKPENDISSGTIRTNGKTPMTSENTTPKPLKTTPAVSKARKTPGKLMMSQPVTGNVWLSKEVGVQMFCNSEPQGSAEKVGKTPKGAKGKKKRKSVQEEDMVECPMCKEEFAASKIQLHAAACNILSSDEDDDVVHVPNMSEKTSLPDPGPGGFLPSRSSFGYYLPSDSQDIEDTADMVDCPICFKKYPNWRIEHHTNKCLAADSTC